MDAVRLLITGGTGLVGNGVRVALGQSTQDSHIVTRYLSSKDGDLKNLETASRIFEEFKPTHVIHLAARVGGLFANQADQIGFLRDNLAMNDNIVQLCADHKVKRAIFCLSTCVFPPNAPLPLVEDSIHSGPPHPSNEGYSMAKRVLECMVRFYREERGCDFICVTPTNMFGPFDNFSPTQSHVMPALIHRAFRDREAGRDSLEVWGSGKPLRQFLHSEDAGKAIIGLLFKPSLSHSHYILTADDEHSIAEVAQAVSDAVGFEKPLTFLTDKADGVFRKTASNERLKAELPELTFRPFREAVRETVEWFKKAREEGSARV